MYIVALCPWDSHVYYDYFYICILVNTMHLCKLFIIKTYTWSKHFGCGSLQ